MEEKKEDTPLLVEIAYYETDKSLSLQTKKFLKSLSFKHFVLAGNSVANMIENIPIRDLDFWVLTTDKFMDVFNELSVKLEDPTFVIYTSMVEIISKNIPIINLILSNKSANDTIADFDFEYCRCYYKQGEIYAGVKCLTAIFTKNIRNEARYAYIRKKRIMKAIDYGYSFNRMFWHYNNKLLNKKRLVCKLCCLIDLDVNHLELGYDSNCKHVEYWNSPYYVSLDDLNEKEFESENLNIKFDIDLKNIDFADIKKQLALWYIKNEHTTKQMMLPNLLLTKDKEIVKKFINNIIIYNPVKHGNYLSFNIDHDVPGIYHFAGDAYINLNKLTYKEISNLKNKPDKKSILKFEYFKEETN